MLEGIVVEFLPVTTYLLLVIAFFQRQINDEATGRRHHTKAACGGMVIPYHFDCVRQDEAGEKAKSIFWVKQHCIVRTNASLDTNFNEQIEIANLFKALSLKLV